MTTTSVIQTVIQNQLNGVRATSFEFYPIDYVNEKGELERGFVQAVTQNVIPIDAAGQPFESEDALFRSDNVRERHTITVYVVRQGSDGLASGTGFSFKKTCIGPKGCVINWDAVHCAYEINLDKASE